MWKLNDEIYVVRSNPYGRVERFGSISIELPGVTKTTVRDRSQTSNDSPDMWSYDSA